MANAAIAYNNLADAGVIVASDQELTLPASNLQNPHVARRWRSRFAPAFALVDLGAATPIDTVALFGMTLGAAGTVRARISSSDATGAAGDVFDSGTVPVDANYGTYIGLLGAPASGRYVRFDLADTGAAFVEAGRVFVGTRTAFTYNHIYGWQRGWVDRSVRTKTRGGQTQIWNDNQYRTLDLTFDFVTEAQMNDLVEAIDVANGQRKDVLMIRDPASSNLARDSIWGLISDLTPASQPTFFDIYSREYKLEERL
jgi:hypothetical protein